MKYYLDVLRKYAVFDGRARRKEYWMFFLFNSIIAFVVGFIEGITLQSGGIILAMPYTLAVLLPGLAVGVRRLHDTGRSGWWLLIALVPLIGAIILLVFLTQDSESGENRYGSNPKTIQSPCSETARLRSAAITLIVAAVIGILYGVWRIYRIFDIHGFHAIPVGYAIHVFPELLLLATGMILLPRVSDGAIPVERARRRVVLPMIAYAAIVFLSGGWRLIGQALRSGDTFFISSSTMWTLCDLVILLFALSLLSSSGQWRRIACTALTVASCIMIAFNIYLSYVLYSSDGDVLGMLRTSIMMFFPIAWILLSGVFRMTQKDSPESAAAIPQTPVQSPSQPNLGNGGNGGFPMPTPTGKGFTKAQFKNGASFSDEALAELSYSRSRYVRAFGTIWVPGWILAIVLGIFLSNAIGGAIPNLLAALLIIGAPLFCSLIIREQKKRYLACRDKLGLTENDIQQA
ncbi:MAG: DUF805 domain-containing protein, partial [Azoarcus sp.]|nr:DUF805 domain-containing protein [Azoarcus sp.]